MNVRLSISPAAPLRFWMISLGFWSSLGISAVLGAIIVLSPRWLEVERYQADYARNAQVIADLKRENAHLARVAHALEFDPEYRARVAAMELRLVVPGEQRIPLGDSLEFNSHSPRMDHPLVPGDGRHWHSALLEMVATTGPVRQRLIAAEIVLILLTFFCLNESFLNGGLRGVLQVFSAMLGERYTIPASAETQHVARTSSAE